MTERTDGVHFRGKGIQSTLCDSCHSVHTRCLDRKGETGKDNLFGITKVRGERKNRRGIKGKNGLEGLNRQEVDKQGVRRLGLMTLDSMQIVS